MKSLQERVEKHVEKALHINLSEHKESSINFVISVLLYSLLGIFVGSIIEEIIRKFQGTKTVNRLDCSSYILLQLLLIALVFLIIIRVGKQIDDWLWSTFDGFLFGITFFAVQTSLSSNMSCLVSIT